MIVLFLAAEILDTSRPGDTRSRGRASNIAAAYSPILLCWIAVVSIFEWRQGLADIGLPEALSWVLAPLGLIAVIALAIASYHLPDKEPWWKWAGLFLLFIAACFAYIVVAAGPAAFFERMTS